MKRLGVWLTIVGFSLSGLVFAQDTAGCHGRKVINAPSGKKGRVRPELARKGKGAATGTKTTGTASPLPVPPKVETVIGKIAGTGNKGNQQPTARRQKKPPRPAPAPRPDKN